MLALFNPVIFKISDSLHWKLDPECDSKTILGKYDLANIE